MQKTYKKYEAKITKNSKKYTDTSGDRNTGRPKSGTFWLPDIFMSKLPDKKQCLGTETAVTLRNLDAIQIRDQT